MSYYLGVDPGLKGGYGVLCDELPGWASPFPLAGKEIDLATLAISWASLVQLKPIAIVERVHAMPKQGVTSCFTFGKGYGSILGVLATLKIPTHLVTPQAWKKVVLAGTTKNKGDAVAYCRQAMPHIVLIPPGCRKPHDGMADALCLADYGRRTFKDHA